jgi:hypothetical protein
LQPKTEREGEGEKGLKETSNNREKKRKRLIIDR